MSPTYRFLIGLGATFASVTVAVAHDHYAWIQKYVNAVGVNCCGETDCIAISATAAQGLAIGSTMTVKFPDGERMVSVNRIYPTEDGSAYICKPGCLFRSPGT